MLAALRHRRHILANQARRRANRPGGKSERALAMVRTLLFAERDRRQHRPGGIGKWIDQVLRPAYHNYRPGQAWSPAVNLYEDAVSMMIDRQQSSPLELAAIYGIPLERAANASAPMPRVTMLHALLEATEPKGRPAP